jgi:hypothetical protein
MGTLLAGLLILVPHPSNSWLTGMLLAFLISFGGLSYLGLSHLLKIPELQNLLNILQRKSNPQSLSR